MTVLRTILDITMCCLWILTYTIVLIGTIEYNYPLISPVAQAIIAPFEFAVLYRYIIKGFLGFDYVSLSYIYWTLIELAIIYVIIKNGFLQKRKVALYILSVCLITCVMCYFVAHKDHMFFFSYFNTFIGELFWLYHVQKKDYPMKPLTLAAFLAKFIGDAISIPVYFGKGPLLIDAICILLPIMDFLFIMLYYVRKRAGKKSQGCRKKHRIS